jgi:hypothetical protein
MPHSHGNAQLKLQCVNTLLCVQELVDCDLPACLPAICAICVDLYTTGQLMSSPGADGP